MVSVGKARSFSFKGGIVTTTIRQFEPARILLFATLLVAVAGLAGAMTSDELTARVGGDRGAEWKSEFAAELSALEAGSRIAPDAFEITARAFAGIQLSGSPDEAARLVFSIALRADRSLRKGLLPGEATLEAKRMVAQLGFGSSMDETSQMRLRRQLANMGGTIFDDMQRRSGPQSGAGAGSGPRGGGSDGGSRSGPTAAGNSDVTAQPSGEVGQ